MPGFEPCIFSPPAQYVTAIPHIPKGGVGGTSLPYYYAYHVPSEEKELFMETLMTILHTSTAYIVLTLCVTGQDSCILFGAITAALKMDILNLYRDSGVRIGNTQICTHRKHYWRSWCFNTHCWLHSGCLSDVQKAFQVRCVNLIILFLQIM